MVGRRRSAEVQHVCPTSHLFSGECSECCAAFTLRQTQSHRLHYYASMRTLLLRYSPTPMLSASAKILLNPSTKTTETESRPPEKRSSGSANPASITSPNEERQCPRTMNQLFSTQEQYSEDLRGHRPLSKKKLDYRTDVLSSPLMGIILRILRPNEQDHTSKQSLFGRVQAERAEDHATDASTAFTLQGNMQTAQS